MKVITVATPRAPAWYADDEPIRVEAERLRVERAIGFIEPEDKLHQQHLVARDMTRRSAPLG